MSHPTTPICRCCWRRGDDLKKPCPHAPAHRPIAAALANAIFDATGARLRTAPFTPERVKAAMGSVRAKFT